MIKINLLPDHLRPKRELVNLHFLGSVVAGIAVLTIVGMFGYMQVRLHTTNTMLTSVTKMQQDLKPWFDRVNGAQKLEQEFEQKNKVVKEVNQSIEKWSELLANVTACAPAKVWLERLDGDFAKGQIIIVGSAANTDLVAQFLTGLQTKGYFTTVEMKSAERKNLKEEMQRDEQRARPIQFEIAVGTKALSSAQKTDKPAGGGKS